MDLTATFTAVGALLLGLAAVGTLIVSIINYRRTGENKQQLIEIDGKVYELGKKVDGRLEVLLGLTDSSARAEGELAGRAAQIANGGREQGT